MAVTFWNYACHVFSPESKKNFFVDAFYVYTKNIDNLSVGFPWCSLKAWKIVKVSSLRIWELANDAA